MLGPVLRAWVGSVALCVAGASVPAAAQDEPAPSQEAARPDAAPAPPGIEAIEVTGERLDDANVQDEAQAITAFTGADLERANIVSVDSLQFNVPGLHVGQSAQAPIITLRGIGTENASLTGEPGVAFHVDGINLGRPAAARVAFFDLETLDVKRGPQGLLGGKNSTSGSINLVTRKPTDEYEIDGSVRWGNYDQLRLRGAVNLPLHILGEGTATRLALYRETRDGFLDNKYASDSDDPFDADDFGLRWHVKMAPTDRLDLLLSYNYFKQDGRGPQADIVPIPKRLIPDGSVPEGTILPPDVEIDCSPEQDQTFTTMPSSARCWRSLVAPATKSIVPRGAAADEFGLPIGTDAAGFPVRRTDRTRRTGVPFQRVAIEPQRGDRVPNSPSWRFATFPEWKEYDPATQDSDPRAIYLDSSPGQRSRYWGWSSRVGWDTPLLPVLGETRVELFGGFQTTIGGIRNDFDATDGSISYYEADDDADQYSGELQWSGLALAERLEWQASFFHLHEQGERDVEVPDLENSRFPGQPLVFGQRVEQATDNKAYGAALHGTFELGKGVRLSLGGRYIKDRKESWFERFLFGNSGSTESKFRGCTGNLGVHPSPPERPRRENVKCSLIDRETMWGAGLDWRPFGDDHLLYARVDRGAKSGGFRVATVGEYLPERIWAYAVGTKSEFFDQRLRVNAEGFFYAYEDMQLVILDGFALRTENTDARMWGWDLETQVSPLDGLDLSALVSYLRTETIDYFSLDPASSNQFQARRLESREDAEARYAQGIRDAQSYFATYIGCYASPVDSREVRCGTLGDQDGLDDFSGNQLSRAPRWKLTLSGSYEVPLGRFGSLTPRVQYTWQDDTYYRAFNRDFDLQEAYHLTDVSLTWSSPEDRWSVEAFVTNVEDEAPKQNVLIGPRFFGSPPLAWYGPPRFYGVQVGFKY